MKSLISILMPKKRKKISTSHSYQPPPKYWRDLIFQNLGSWKPHEFPESFVCDRLPCEASPELRKKWFKVQSRSIAQESLLNRNWSLIASNLRRDVLKEHPDKDSLRTFKFRIYPDSETVKRYDHLFGAQRFIRRDMLAFIEKYIAKARKFNNGERVSKRDGITLHITEKKVSVPVKTSKRTSGSKSALRGKTIKKTIQVAKPLPSVQYLRTLFVTNTSKYVRDNPWMKEIAADFRGEVARDCLKNYDSAFKRYKNDGKPFTIGTKTKRQERNFGCSFAIPSKHWYRGSWSELVPKDYRCIDRRTNNKLPKTIARAARLKRYPGNKYYICIPMPLPPSQRSSDNLLVIDPGYRTGFTGINFKDNILEEIGVGISKRISYKLHGLNKLRSKISKAKHHRQRYHMRKAFARASLKISTMIDDFHKCTAKYMCENYSTIVIPKLNFHTFTNLSKKQKSMTARVSHCSFVDCLITKSKQYRNCKVIVVEEQFTSKICSRCGYYHKTLGASKVFDCPKCKSKIDRDENAVYNILMKTLHENAFSFPSNLTITRASGGPGAHTLPISRNISDCSCLTTSGLRLK